MTFTYSGPNESGVFATPRDEVRYLARDTVQGPSSATDEEIAYRLAVRNGDVYLAAADIVDQRIGYYETQSSGQRSSKKVGDLALTTTSYSATLSGLRKLAEDLRMGTTGGSPAIVLGPLGTETGYDPIFRFGMNDFPGTALPR